ncbi:MAG: hypothetical protein HAW58_06955, partial [Candidatus Thioglobus sp.]|nr:hypothetical protein [Candidatus Thioglobus sp.]
MNILNRFLAITILAILAVTLASCGGGSSNGLGSGSVSGMASKGPFMADSTVTAYVLATDGSRNTATAAIPPINTGKLGAFAFDNLAGNVELEVYGFYLNENTGNTSTAPATLTSVVAVGGSANNFNINVFTDIEAGHIKALMAAGNTFADAKTVATTTVADLFNLSAEANLSELDLTDGSNEDNLILLRASAAIAKTPTILVDLQTAISADDTAAQAQEVANINANIASLDFAMIAQNIAALGSTTVTAAALTALNKAPTISEFPNLISTIEDATSGFLGGNLAVMDDSDSVDDITIIGSSTNPNLVDRVVITPFTSISAPAVNHTIEIILKENAHGNATIIITATDSDGLSNSAQFPLTISPVVDAVEAAAGTPTAVTLSENDPAGTVVVSAAAAKSYFINVD